MTTETGVMTEIGMTAGTGMTAEIRPPDWERYPLPGGKLTLAQINAIVSHLAGGLPLPGDAIMRDDTAAAIGAAHTAAAARAAAGAAHIADADADAGGAAPGPGPLAGLKVLDFTHYIAGAYCAKLLADYGAEVVKVERPPHGDGARRLGPFPGDVPHSEKSGLFLHLNTNKRSLALDLKAEGAGDIVRRLAAWADVALESYRPGVAARLGIGYEALRAVNPGIIYTSISNFGQTGPYRDYRGSEIVFYGMGGEMHSTGLADREPLKLGGNVGLYQAGAVAATATMGAALAGAFAGDGGGDSSGDGDGGGDGDSGGGRHIDVSILETQLGSVDRRQSALLAYQYTGEISRRPATAGSGGYPNAVYPCADGYFQINGSRMYFPRAVAMLGSPAALAEPRWQDPAAQGDGAMQEEFEGEHFLPWILERSRAEAWAAAQEHRVLSGPINTMADLDADPSFNGRGVFADGEHPAAGALRYPGRPFLMGASPWRLRRTAPLLGQHSGEILSELGYDADAIAAFIAGGVIMPAPLPTPLQSDDAGGGGA